MHGNARLTPEGRRFLVEVRQTRKRGPARIGMLLEMPASTVWRVLRPHGMNRLRWMDRPAGRVIRRCEKSALGELVHIDIKKLGRIPDGGDWEQGRRNSGRYRAVTAPAQALDPRLRLHPRRR